MYGIKKLVWKGTGKNASGAMFNYSIDLDTFEAFSERHNGETVSLGFFNDEKAAKYMCQVHHEAHIIQWLETE